MDIPENLKPLRAGVQVHAMAVHVVDVDAKVTPQMALDPNFWPHLVAKFHVGDEAVVRPKDRSWRLHADIVAIDPAGHWALLRPITLTEGSPLAKGADDDSGYRIDHDPVQKWRILNGRDLIAHGLPDEAAAVARLREIKAKKTARAA